MERIKRREREKIVPLYKSGTIRNIDRMIVAAFRRKPFHLALPRPTNGQSRNRSFHALVPWLPFRIMFRCETAKNKILRRLLLPCQSFDHPASKLPDRPSYSICGLTAKPLEIVILRTLDQTVEINVRDKILLYLRFVNLIRVLNPSERMKLILRRFLQLVKNVPVGCTMGEKKKFQFITHYLLSF